MRRFQYLTIGLFGVILCAALVIFSRAQQADGAGPCVQKQGHLIAKGESPAGTPWTVTGTIRNNGSCKSWFFGMKFLLSKTGAGSTTWGWRIPAGGHLSDRFTISAQDEVEESSERAFSGAAAASVATIVLTMSDGKRITLHPKLPSNELREKFVWLRNVRYFVMYYSGDRHVKAAKLLDRQGKLIEKSKGFEGEFQGASFL